MGNLSPEEEAKLKKDVKEKFDEIDTDKSGMIEKNEFRNLCVKVAKNMGGKPATEEDFEKTFKEFDKDNSGTISFDEVYKNWGAFSILVGFSEA